MYFAPEKALRKRDEVYEIVAVTPNAAVMPIDFHKYGYICYFKPFSKIAAFITHAPVGDTTLIIRDN